MTDRPSPAPRHAMHPRPAAVGLVALGGVAGTALREAIVLAIGPTGDFPLAIFLINLSGAFVLGALLQSLARRGDDTGARLRVRLLVGTGVLGGYTTYSALSTDSAHLVADGGAGIGLALAYGLATVLLGGLASWFGMLAGGLHRRAAAPPIDPDTTPRDADPGPGDPDTTPRDAP